MKICYQEKTFRATTRAMIDGANKIISEYLAAGFKLTLRQLYYQFVSRDLLENTVKSYKNLGSVVNDGRLAGLIDWDSIEDRTRHLSALSTWENPQSIIDACASQYRVDMWEAQPYYVEVWIEKEALAGVFERVCNEMRVPFFCARGYNSQSEQWAAGRRLRKIMEGKGVHRGRKALILHFGDHDPSGLDMTRDNRDRLEMFTAPHVAELKRIALNMNQVEQYSPPPNPAKATDARFEGYQREFGDESWELDALDPTVLADLVRAELKEIIDEEAWGICKDQEDEQKEQLEKVSSQWDSIVDGLE